MPLLLFLILADVIVAVQKQRIFHIRRNKNRNLVQYAIKMTPACQPDPKKPIYGYWRMLEKSPNATESIGWLEKKAYGIDEQEIKNGQVQLTLVALPRRKIVVKTTGTKGKCQATAYVMINKSYSVLKEVYVFAKEGFIKPTVKYIEIKGKKGGVAVKEKILKD